MSSAEVEHRVVALRELAQLTEHHVNAPSAALARSLARGLTDEAVDVRAEVVLLLADGQHPEVAVTELVKASRACRKEYVALGDELEATKIDTSELLEDLRRELDGRAPKKSKAAAERDRRKSQAEAERRELAKRQFEALPALQVLLARELGKFPDRRAERELLALLEDRSLLLDSPEVARSLGRIGGRDAAAGLVEHLEWYEEAGAPGAIFPREIIITPGGLSGLIEVPSQLPSALQDALSELAERHGLPGAPERGPAVAAQWRAWFREHRRELPDLGAMPMPWDQ